MFRSCRSPFISPLYFLGICPILQVNEWQSLCPEKSRVSMSWETIDLDEIVFFHKCKMENACLKFILLFLNPCRTSWIHSPLRGKWRFINVYKDSPNKKYNNPGADWHPWLWGVDPKNMFLLLFLKPENMLIFVVTYGLLVQFFCLMSYPDRVKQGHFC